MPVPVSNQFIRYISLKVGKRGGSGLELSNLKIEFDITKTSAKEPNKGTIKVYNLNQETRNRMLKEFDIVELDVGYKNGSHGVILKGDIAEVTETRNNFVDIIIELKVEDGGLSSHYSTSNFTLAKGSTEKDLVDKCIADLKARGVEPGEIDDSLFNHEYIRGIPVFEKSVDVIEGICKQKGLEFSIQDGKVQITQAKQTTQTEAVVIGSKYGLIDPGIQTTEKGIKFKTLLNTKLKVGCPVKIEEEGYTQRYVNKVKQEKSRIPQSGQIYKVIQVKHSGNTRDKQWYSECECVSYTSQAIDQNDLR